MHVLKEYFVVYYCQIMTGEAVKDSIFWVDVDKIKPNPYQPRREFDEARLRELSDSIRQYGVLQPLVVTRTEVESEDGIAVNYELIAGERRLRASKLAGVSQVPVIIRYDDSNMMKLELAIIENLQREDLNSIDRAKAFQRLVDEFGFKHGEIGKKVGKSREFVSNTLRLLTLPEEMQIALAQGKISEGHTRPLMMLTDRKEEQETLFKEMIFRKMTVREAENIARRIAFDRARKKDRLFDPEIVEMEEKLAETLGTRVQIERKDVGGKIHIDFFTYEDLQSILKLIKENQEKGKNFMLHRAISQDPIASANGATIASEDGIMGEGENSENLIDDRSKEEKALDEDQDFDLYNVKNFSV